MNTKVEYKNFIKDHFGNQEIKSGLFFTNRNSLRFDLQTGEPDTDDYFQQVIKRSTDLFEAVFEPTDELFLVIAEYKWKRRKIRPANYCFKQLIDFEKKEVEFYQSINRYERGDRYNVGVIRIRTDKLNYKNILIAIANTDFPPREPRFRFSNSPEIYFANIDKKVIFHMYDDRGLDIISSDIETLKPIQLNYNSWILDANRAEIYARMKC